MAMICKTGARECDGCMACHTDPEPIGRCSACDEPIFPDDERYNIEGELIHEDCLSVWAEPYKEMGC